MFDIASHNAYTTMHISTQYCNRHYVYGTAISNTVTGSMCTVQLYCNSQYVLYIGFAFGRQSSYTRNHRFVCNIFTSFFTNGPPMWMMHSASILCLIRLQVILFWANTFKMPMYDLDAIQWKSLIDNYVDTVPCTRTLFASRTKTAIHLWIYEDI